MGDRTSLGGTGTEPAAHARGDKTVEALLAWRMPLLLVVLVAEMLVAYVLVAMDAAIPSPGMTPADEAVSGFHPGVLLAFLYTCGLGACAAASLLFAARWPQPAFWVACMLGAASGFLVAPTIAIARIAAGTPRRTTVRLLLAYSAAVVIGAFTPLGLAVGRWFFEAGTVVLGAVLLRVVLAALVSSGILLARSVHRVEDLEAARKTQEAQERLDFAQKAVLEERNRIAREMHDAIGHKVSLIALHAGALQLKEADPQKQAPITVIRDASLDALAELREVLDVLDDERPDTERDVVRTIADIERLVAASRAAGIDVAYDPIEVQASAQVSFAAYRIVQEGLANVHKHAPGGPATLRLASDGTVLAIDLENRADVATGAPSAFGRGSGLIGVAERAHRLGGQASWKQVNDTWALHAELPLERGTKNAGNDE